MSIIKRFALAVCLVTTLTVVAAAQQPMNASDTDTSGAGQMKKSLYARLGGYDAIATVVDDFIGRLVADQRFTRFFVGHSEDSRKRIRMHVIDQLCAAAGGPCLYIGCDMKASRHGLGITSDDWDASAKHLVESLDKFNVPKAEKDELLAFVGTLKKDIVAK
ncbi:MAG TPA: group 1 truncated hemoglobin [Pyrinomonadaceae bacterium]|nr:group 1 truncated hemoglobin [Pyrinomonadaceae bacterium]